MQKASGGPSHQAVSGEEPAAQRLKSSSEHELSVASVPASNISRPLDDANATLMVLSKDEAPSGSAQPLPEPALASHHRSLHQSSQAISCPMPEVGRGDAPCAAARELDKIDSALAASARQLTSPEVQNILATMTDAIQRVLTVFHHASAAAAAAAGKAGTAQMPLAALTAELTRLASQASQQAAALSHQAPAAAAAMPARKAGPTGVCVAAPAAAFSEAQEALAAMQAGPHLTAVTPQQTPAAAAAMPLREAAPTAGHVAAAAAETNILEAQEASAVMKFEPQLTGVPSHQASPTQTGEAVRTRGGMAEPSTLTPQDPGAASEARRLAEAVSDQASSPATAAEEETQGCAESGIEAAAEHAATSPQIPSAASDAATAASLQEDPPAEASSHWSAARATAAADSLQECAEEGGRLAADDTVEPAQSSSAAYITASAASLHGGRPTEALCQQTSPPAAGAAMPRLSPGEGEARAAPAGSTGRSAEGGLQAAFDHTVESAQSSPAASAAAPEAAAACDRTTNPVIINAELAAGMADNDLPVDSLSTPAAALAPDSKKVKAAPAEGGPGEGPTATTVFPHLPISRAASAEARQACVAALSDQQTTAASCEPASAAAAAQSGTSEATPAQEKLRPLRPHEQKVAAALLVVLQRALKDGTAALERIMDILTINNPHAGNFAALAALSRFYDKLPSLKELDSLPSLHLRKSLGLLSRQCAAAGCQPLEVFTRSAQCLTHHAALATDKRQRAARLQRLEAIETSLAVRKGPESEHDEHHICCRLVEAVQLLAQHGVSSTSRKLICVILQEVMVLLHADKAPQLEGRNMTAGSATSFTTCIDHMLPDVLDGLLEHEGEDLTSVDALLKMVPRLESALDAYRNLAAAAKTSPAHMVMLEAAVQGWPLNAPHSTCLPEKIMAALASDAKASQPPASAGKPAAACVPPSSPQVAPEPEQARQSSVPDALMAGCPSDLKAILSCFLGSLDISEPDRLLERVLCEQHPRALLTELFPGIMEELCCAVNSQNTGSMREALFKAAGRHIQSTIKVWMIESLPEDSGFKGLLDKKTRALGFEPDELPSKVYGALFDISTRMQADTDRVALHRHITVILAAMQDVGKAGVGATADIWLLKALAQLVDLRIYDANQAAFVRAERILMPGILEVLLRPSLTREGLVTAMRMMKDDVRNYAIAARDRGGSLRGRLEERGGYMKDGRQAGDDIATHLIDILVDRVGPLLSTAAACQEGPFGESWRRLEVEYPLIAPILQSAFHIAITMDSDAFDAVCRFLPGCSNFVTASTLPVTDSGLQQAAKRVDQQIQVHKHIASVVRRPFSNYMESFLYYFGSDIGQQPIQAFWEGVCKAADSIVDIDLAMVKRMHISMSIKNTIGVYKEVKDYYMVLLDEVMSICAENTADSLIAKAIRQALPGVLELLLRLHKWPQGLPQEPQWPGLATRLVRGITAQHARDASNQSILGLEAHLRSIIAVPGLRDADAELIVGAFTVLWSSRSHGETVAGNGAITQIPNGAGSASPGKTPGDSSASPEEQSSSAKAGGAAAAGGRTAAESQELSQQGGDAAADVADGITKGASSGTPNVQAGPGEPEQTAQEAAEPQSALTEAEKAEKRRAKKARQRAARAQAAAQTAEAEGTDCKEPGSPEGINSASKQSVEAQAVKQPLEAVSSVSEPLPAAPGSLPAQTAPGPSSQAVASSGGSSLPPQPSLQLPTGVSHAQQEPDLPSRSAPAAQTSGPAAQEEEPWQEVRTSRRKSLGQRAASKGVSRRAPKQGRSKPDQEKPALSALRLRELQPDAHIAEQAVPSSNRAVMPTHAASGHAAAEQLPHWLSALSHSDSQQQSHGGKDPLQSPGPQALPTSMQLEPSPATSSATPPDETHAALQQRPLPRLRSETPSHEETAQATLFQEDRDDVDDLCIVCWERVREVIFYNCMHMCTCQGCARDIMAAGALCPMCRRNIQSTITARF